MVPMKFSKEDLNNLRGICVELERLEQERDALKEKLNSYITIDTVTGSSPVHPYTSHPVSIRGISDTEQYIHTREALRIKEMELLHTQKLKKQMEDFINAIPDCITRTVFAMRFLQGKSWQSIAFKIGGHDESFPRKKVDRFFKKN